MYIVKLILTASLSVFLFTQNATTIKCSAYESIKYSEFGYFHYLGGHLIGKYLSKIKAYCNNKEVSMVLGYKSSNGDYEEKISNGSYSKYKKVWKKFEFLNVWDLCTITPEKFPEQDDDPEILLKLYRELRSTKSTYKFFFRINEKENDFMIYDIFQLEDKRYQEILKAINSFFKIQTFIE